MPRPAKAGRRAGTPNRKTKELQEIADRVGVCPFEVLCLVAKGDARKLGYEFEPDAGPSVYMLSVDQRIAAAKEASKYLYPQRKAIEVANSDDVGFKVIVEDYTTKEKK